MKSLDRSSRRKFIKAGGIVIASSNRPIGEDHSRFRRRLSRETGGELSLPALQEGEQACRPCRCTLAAASGRASADRYYDAVCHQPGAEESRRSQETRRLDAAVHPHV